MGFFEGVGKFLNSAAGAAANASRNSDNPELAMNYLDYFDKMLKNGQLDQLEKMLKDGAYRVKLDRENDYKRERQLTERVRVLREEQRKKTDAEIASFDKWLSSADLNALESGLANGKYKIRYDEKGDNRRKAKMEEKLARLREKQAEKSRQDDIKRMGNLFRDYLIQTEKEIHKSCFVYSDFQDEICFLPKFQQQIIDERYGKAINDLLSLPDDEFSQTMSDFIWQVDKEKTVAGQSIMVLLLASLDEEDKHHNLIMETLEKIEDIMERYFPKEGVDIPNHIDVDYDYPVDELRYYAGYGVGWAMGSLGDYYQEGYTVPKDLVLANYWFLKAAKLFDGTSAWILYEEISKGRNGFEKDKELAGIFLRMAADKGQKEAIEKLSEINAAEEQRRQKAQEQERENTINAALSNLLALKDKLSAHNNRIVQMDSKIAGATNPRDEAKFIEEKDALLKQVSDFQAEIDEAGRKCVELIGNAEDKDRRLLEMEQKRGKTNK